MLLLYRRLLGIKDLMIYVGIRVTVMESQPQIKYEEVMSSEHVNRNFYSVNAANRSLLVTTQERPNTMVDNTLQGVLSDSYNRRSFIYVLLHTHTCRI